MIRTTRFVTEMKCKSCNIIHLLGQTFDGKRCCSNPNPIPIGEREIVEYTKTNEEEKQDVYLQMANSQDDGTYTKIENGKYVTRNCY